MKQTDGSMKGNESVRGAVKSGIRNSSRELVRMASLP